MPVGFRPVADLREPGSQTVMDASVMWFEIDDESKRLDPYTLRVSCHVSIRD